MEVIDEHTEDHLNWFGYVSDNPDEQPPLSFRVALEEFYNDHVEEKVYLGYVKYKDGDQPIYLIGTGELKVINDLNKEFADSIELRVPNGILCLV